MKKLLFIFLLGLSFSCVGQDSLQIYFGNDGVEISNETANEINNFLKNKKAERIQITAYFSTTGSPSQNRLLAEKQLQNVQTQILNYDIPFNIVSSALILIEDGNSKSCDLKIVANFAATKGARVLKKSSVVEISDFDFTNSRKVSTLVYNEPVKNQEPESIESETEKEIVLDKAAFKKDATVSLPNLIFQSSTHYFISSSERVLRALLKVMQSRTGIEIELQGHVCCNPPGVDALDIITGQNNLSLMRAKAVYNYLVEGGISETRMTYTGFGSSQRLYPEEKNDTEKTLNRRVEVLVTKGE